MPAFTNESSSSKLPSGTTLHPLLTELFPLTNPTQQHAGKNSPIMKTWKWPLASA
jgi:hypothetical protein